MQLDGFIHVSRIRGHGQVEHHLIPAAVRLFSDYRGAGMVRENGERQRIGKPEERVSLLGIVSKIVDHNRQARVARGCYCRRGGGTQWRDEMDRLRAPALREIVE